MDPSPGDVPVWDPEPKRICENFPVEEIPSVSVCGGVDILESFDN